MIDEKLQEESWELLLEVVSLGERHGVDSDKLTPYHTKLLTLVAKRVEEAEFKLTQKFVQSGKVKLAPNMYDCDSEQIGNNVRKHYLELVEKRGEYED